MSKVLHIVSFDVPYPADYGGVIDIYHKIRVLKQLKVDVILHCFQYGRKESDALNKVCKKVFYYKRSKYRNPFIGEIPYIVLTRNDDELLMRLLKDLHPILFEGIHCTYFLNHPQLKNRLKLVRNHNIEHDYYKNLELVESNYFKKYFFRNESDKLKNYEKTLKHADYVLSISPSDHNYMQKKYHNSVLVPAFHANDGINILEGKGKFILYHGNLSVGENHHAAMFLVKEVFSKMRLPCTIAGNNPNADLIKICQNHPHIQLISNWNNQQITDAIREAHINVLPTFQGTGIKLKLLNALYGGRFCIVNPTMVANTTLESACVITEDADKMVEAIEEHWKQSFDKEHITKREAILKKSLFDNIKNAEIILNLLSSQNPS